MNWRTDGWTNAVFILTGNRGFSEIVERVNERNRANRKKERKRARSRRTQRERDLGLNKEGAADLEKRSEEQKNRLDPAQRKRD